MYIFSTHYLEIPFVQILCRQMTIDLIHMSLMANGVHCKHLMAISSWHVHTYCILNYKPIIVGVWIIQYAHVHFDLKEKSLYIWPILVFPFYRCEISLNKFIFYINDFSFVWRTQVNRHELLMDSYIRENIR